MREIWCGPKLITIFGGWASLTMNRRCQRMVRKLNLWQQSQTLMICVLSRERMDLELP
ncbi:hypothetical protein HanXRQr2_Chr04g0161671 [Helianthus annuus]|uniref:Uncharacterized protein n=1 Tax=Helianthus annuus TaxID=4232 RepID=A0A9K3J8E9_HELAN|nr:hypothetical protein HanXRQr2_Chr04g0161671 [Helianthus annuus]KAJ0930965.1 hypothetical protein HanPSC8_Chr04g0155771 [Helianthus annuus]